jgi:hypothetical protein
MKTSDFILGLVLVCLGLIFLADNLDYIALDFPSIWPGLLILAGIAFATGYFKNNKNYGLLLPATILVVFGLLFLYCTIAGWENMNDLWPVFLMGPGLGFYLMYQFGEKEKGLLIPAAIMVGLGLLFLLDLNHILKYWSVILIAVGGYLIYKHYRTVKRAE